MSTHFNAWHLLFPFIAESQAPRSTNPFVKNALANNSTLFFIRANIRNHAQVEIFQSLIKFNFTNPDALNEAVSAWKGPVSAFFGHGLISIWLHIRPVDFRLDWVQVMSRCAQLSANTLTLGGIFVRFLFLFYFHKDWFTNSPENQILSLSLDR